MAWSQTHRVDGRDVGAIDDAEGSREVLRLKYELGRSRAEIAASVGVGASTVSSYIERASQAGLTWAVASGMSDADVESRLFDPPPIRWTV